MLAQRPPSPLNGSSPAPAPALANITARRSSGSLARPSSKPASSLPRRKPLPVSASPLASRLSQTSDYSSPGQHDDAKLPFSPYDAASPPPSVLSPPLTNDEADWEPRDLDA